MADCAGILLGVSDVLETPVRKSYFLELSRIWADVAAETAGRDMSDRVDETAAEWREKGMLVGFSQDYKDWMSYCRSLARHRDITFPKPPWVGNG